MDLAQLHDAVAAVCPIVGVRYGPPTTFDPAPEATPQQLLAAQAVIDGWDFSDAEAERRAARRLLEFLTTPEGRVLRAIVALLVDGDNAELNDLRGWLTDFKAATAAATSLADFKVRVAALPNLPDLTMAQAVTAIKNRITGNA